VSCIIYGPVSNSEINVENKSVLSNRSSATLGKSFVDMFHSSHITKETFSALCLRVQCIMSTCAVHYVYVCGENTIRGPVTTHRHSTSLR
jgi:hypothetical protein